MRELRGENTSQSQGSSIVKHQQLVVPLLSFNYCPQAKNITPIFKLALSDTTIR